MADTVRSEIDAGADDRAAPVVVTLTRIVALTRLSGVALIWAGVR
jgi:hypothetical protein